MYLVLLLQQLIASGTSIVAKSVTGSLDAHTVVLLRGLLASVGYGVWITVSGGGWKRIERQDMVKLLLLGLINIPINQFLFVSGVGLSSAPNAALMYALTPTFVLIIAKFFLGESLSKGKVIGIGLALAGTILVLSEKEISFSSASLQGDILLLLASLSWAVYTVMGKSFVTKYGAVYATGLTMFTGTLLFIPVYFFFPTQREVAEISLPEWGQLIYLGWITSGLGYALWYWALTKLEASRVSVFNNLQPVITTGMAIYFFDHTPTVLFAIGGATAILGVLVTQLSALRRSRQQQNTSQG